VGILAHGSSFSAVRGLRKRRSGRTRRNDALGRGRAQIRSAGRGFCGKLPASNSVGGNQKGGPR
jgi:hypothetical protein